MSSVLLVDDDPMALRVVRLAFERAGYEVRTAGDGAEAMQILRDQPFDVVVTDLNMPRMNGHELCKAIYEECADRIPAIFLLTARPGEHHRVEAKELADVEFLEKPASLRNLLARVAGRLSQAGEQGAESA